MDEKYDSSIESQKPHPNIRPIKLNQQAITTCHLDYYLCINIGWQIMSFFKTELQHDLPLMITSV
jgi:hypothetical protein